MKLPLLALLCAGTAAFCQSPAPHTVDPDKLFQMPERFSETAPDLRKPAISQKMMLTPMHPDIVILPGPKNRGPQWKNPQIDPRIILHPPLPKGEDQPQGEDVSHNLYPNLKFLPIRKAAHGPR
jgi:hypothetical protein